MHAAILEHRDEIADLGLRFGVKRLEAFGSAARATDFDASRSDADFLVEFTPRPELTALRQYFGFAEAMRDLLGREVDLVNGKIDNPYLKAGIDRDKELVFAA